MMTAKQDTARESLGWWQGFCGTSTPADVRNNRRLVVATVVWVLAFLASLVVMERYGDDSLAVSSAALAVAGVAWIPVVRAYLRFLRETDELTRLIQMQAMAVGFACGLLMTLLDPFVERVASFLPDPLVGSVQLVDIFNAPLIMCAAFVTTMIVLYRWYAR